MSPMRIEGLMAYAKRQAGFYRDLRRKFMWLWRDVPSYVSRMQAIIADPSIMQLGELDKKTKVSTTEQVQILPETSI